MAKPWGYWNRDTVYQLAKGCSSRGELKNKNSRAYLLARENGWLDDYDWFERKKNPYTDKIDNVYAYFFNDFKAVYIGRSIEIKKRKWRHNTDEKSTVFKFAKENGIAVPDMVILESNLSLDKGLELEDYYVKKYKEDGWNVLNKSKTGKGSGSLGGSAKRWNRHSVYQEALKYKTYSDFQKGSVGAYESAWRNGWLDDYDWFREVRNRPKTVVKLTLKGVAISIFNSTGDAGRQNGCQQQKVCACCNGNRKTSGGYRWLYFDDYEQYY